MSTANLFNHYKQSENHFTNGLISILSLCRVEHPALVESFLGELLGLRSPEWKVNTFQVLPGADGTIDGELGGKECCLWFESKIQSGTLDGIQIRQHLNGKPKTVPPWKGLYGREEHFKRLILLTPDDSKSNYLKQFLDIDPALILHLEWRRVYSFFQQFTESIPGTTLAEVISQFLKTIQEMVFTQDIAGVILKIQFGDHSEVYHDKYLQEMKAGDWECWNTPGFCKHLDGKGRRLLLYDPVCQGITVDVEIESVTQNGTDTEFTSRNTFAPGTLHVLNQPINLQAIEKLGPKFLKFKSNRSPYQILTQEQYRTLIGSVAAE